MRNYQKTRRITAVILFTTAIIFTAAKNDPKLSDKLKAASNPTALSNTVKSESISSTAAAKAEERLQAARITKTDSDSDTKKTPQAAADSKAVKSPQAAADSKAVKSPQAAADSKAVKSPQAAADSNAAVNSQAVKDPATDTEPFTDSGTDTGPLQSDTLPSLTLTMVGDILFHTPVAQSGIQSDGRYNFDALFAQTAPVIREADLAIVNQEVIIGGTELGITGYPSFNAPYELADALVDAGFDVILHATNHALDKGKQGILNCLNYWESAYPDVAVLGIHDSQKDQNQIYTYEHDGIRVAILNYTYGTNGIPLPEEMPYAVDLLETKRVKKDLVRAGKAADFVIVCPHWGTEFLLEPSDEQETWTQFFLENGADLVIGTHPHVLEPVTQIPKDNGKPMLVYYSLGNFVNWTSSTGDDVSNRMIGGMAQIKLQKDRSGDVFIARYTLEPLVTHLENGTNGVTTYFLKDYTKKLAEKNEIRAQDPAFSLKYCRKLCKKIGINPN